MGTMRTKCLHLTQLNYERLAEDIVKPFADRVNAQNERLESGNLDAPYFPDAIDLGPENLSRSPDKDKLDQIYKVNVPGYFYRQHYKGGWTHQATAGILVAGDPNSISSESSRMVYMAGSDSSIGHANNLYPILPGSHTYVYIVRGASSDIREWLFVPTVLGASVNVHPDSFLSRVGKLRNKITSITGYGNPNTVASAFEGDWANNFKSVCGWNVADESNMSFIDTGEADFIAERKAWITSLGANLETQGYA